MNREGKRIRPGKASDPSGGGEPPLGAISRDLLDEQVDMWADTSLAPSGVVSAGGAGGEPRVHGSAAGLARDTEVVLLLSIQPQHAERIFNGSKHYELRKALPNASIRRVYLYVTGNRGVVGCFDAGAVVRQPIDKLWASVGTAATTYDRFRQYFAKSKEGFAIEIRNPVEFEHPIPLDRIRVDYPTLTAPMSYVTLQAGHSALGLLENARREALRRLPPPVLLRPIAALERQTYRALVQKHIGANYDQIDASFANRTLEVHDIGHDPAGFFTARKEVLAVESAGRCLGFTTLTFKSGYSVKTGPTILLPEYQNKGFGQAIRRAVEERARRAGARKIYCTAADTAFDTVRYLLASGMRVEAHLRRHYSLAHDELVFGKFLEADEYRQLNIPRLPRRRATPSPPSAFRRRDLARLFRRMFSSTWYPVTMAYAETIVRSTLGAGAADVRDHAQKPKRMVCLRSGDECVGAVVLLPKRGGAVKALLLRSTNHESSLAQLIATANECASTLEQRKIYYLHPVDDTLILKLLRKDGFAFEGLLRAPYVRGQDVVVASKFL